MAFKRYDNIAGSLPQQKMDNELPICPFCGEDPRWTLELKPGFMAAMTCRCEKCGGKLYTENHGFFFEDDMRVVDVGKKNLNGLVLGEAYHIHSLYIMAKKGISDK